MFNPIFKITVFASKEKINQLMDSKLDVEDFYMLDKIEESGIPFCVEHTPENKAVGYFYDEDDVINQNIYILTKIGIQFDIEKLDSYEELPKEFTDKLNKFMEKNFTIDDVLDKINIMGITQEDKNILEKLLTWA